MEHAINHFLVFENFLKWLFHKIIIYFKLSHGTLDELI